MSKTLLDIDYTIRDEKPVIRLFYKEKDKRNVEEVSGFEPYFYAIPDSDIDKLIKELRGLNKVVRVDKKSMINVSKKIDVTKIIVKQPGDVPELREHVKALDSCKEVREAGIPFAHRYLIDSKLVPMEDAEFADLLVGAFDIEVYAPKGDPNAERDPAIVIGYADSKGFERVWTYKKISGSNLKYVEFVDDEQEMIKKFVETVKERGVDIITGYNTDNFDFPYLKDRAAKYKIELDLGIDGSDIKLERRGMNLGAKVRGRPHIDTFPICRQNFNFPRYRLEDVYLGIFGEEKKSLITVSEIFRSWESKNAEDFKKLMEYSISDVRAALKIALAVLPLEYELSRILRHPIYETSRLASGQRVEQLLMIKAHEKGILIPNRPSDNIANERQSESYVGAYVVEPVKGIHDNILLFDFRSLYPSIIISHNVDPSTMDCDCCKNDGYKAPTGHYFCKNKKGFIPEILEGLISKRMETKARQSKEKDAEKKKMLDVQQQALKILANSMYGYYAFARARWYSKDCAEAITAWGREYIHQTIKDAEAHGFKVIYGDTDSIFIVKLNEKDAGKIKESAKALQDYINKKLPGSMELEFEGMYPRGIFITKKRYALMDEHKKLTVKGLETRRRDWANIAKETQEKVLNAILQDRSPEKAANIVRDAIKNIKDGKVKLADLAINTQITRKMGEYVQEGPHIVAAKKAMKQGTDFKEGSIVTYIVTRRGKSISDKSVVIDFVKEGDYDAEYYINNQLLPAVMRILEALGYSEEQLKGLGKQMGIGEW